MVVARTIVLFRKVPSWFGRDILLPFVATRLALTIIAWLAFHFMPLPSSFPLSWEIGKRGAVEPTRSGAPQAHPFINMWSRWDAGWYLEIAKRGYSYKPDQPSSVAFFPLYPGAIRLLHALLPFSSADGSYLLVGIALSNICLVVGLIYLHALIFPDYGRSIAARTILCLLLFPTSFFFSAVYSESLFFALSVASFYYARRQWWVSSCTLAALAVLCRSQGIILIAPLFIEYLAQREWRPRLIKWNILALLLIPGAILIFACYLRWLFGSWSILVDAQRPWGRRLLMPWYTLRWVVTHASVVAGMKNDLIDLGFFILLVAGALVFSLRLRISYVIYLWAAALFFSCWGMLGSVPRFVPVLFPLFVGLAFLCQRNRAFRIGYLSLSFVLSAVFFVMFSQWQWVA